MAGERRVFPARAGMSPVERPVTGQLTCVPRASGDEPAGKRLASYGVMCSPRERG